MDRPFVEEILRRAKVRAEREGRRRLFRLTPSAYYRLWRKACQRLGYDPGPPHSLRHTGGSFDALESSLGGKAYRTLDAIQKRGRWRVASSVARYSKTHTYNRALAEMPEGLRRRGAELYRRFGTRSQGART